MVERDKTWDALGVRSFGRFQKLVPEVQFQPQVHKDIVKEFEVVNKLLRHSYYEYQFLDMALTKTVLAFELALKIRYRELSGNNPIKHYPNLRRLIKWGAEKGLFEEKEPVIQTVRKLRNSLAHPRHHSFARVVALNAIQSVGSIIEDLYENVTLRKTRKKAESGTNSKLDAMVEEGARLEIDGSSLIVFSALLLCHDNRSSPEQNHLLFWPIFEIVEKDRTVEISDPIAKRCESLTINNESWYFKEVGSSQEIRLSKLNSAEDIQRFNRWQEDFETSNFPLRDVINMHIGEHTREARKSLRNRG